MVKKKSQFNNKLIILIAVIIIAAAAIAIQQSPMPRACTEEAKICPDGSAVGRTLPNCEFAPCPSECKCPEGYIQEGNACTPECYYNVPRCLMPSIQCSNEAEELCKSSGGTVTNTLCCKSASDFPNTCLIGACGCSPDNSKEVKFCDCGDGKCWDGNSCIIAVATSDVARCEIESDCVGAECCHPTSCINKEYRGVCNMLCTQDCQGPLDCGAGSCKCVNYKCTVVPR